MPRLDSFYGDAIEIKVRNSANDGVKRFRINVKKHPMTPSRDLQETGDPENSDAFFIIYLFLIHLKNGNQTNPILPNLT